MDAIVVILAALGSLVWQGVPTADSPLKVTLDVAQIVMLAGLIWRMAKMSAAVDHNTEAIVNLTKAGETASQFMSDIGSRVYALERIDNDRRDRRHDDA